MQPSALAVAAFLLATRCVAQVADSGTPTAEAPPACCAAPPRFAATTRLNATELAIAPTAEGVRITVGGQPFAEYRRNDGRQPAVWPIVGPGGLPMTRSWPVGPREPGEAVDHPHHVSLWFAHGGVNGADFWHAPEDGGNAANRIIHRGFTALVVVAGNAVVAARNDWMAGERRVLADERALVFGVDRSASASNPPARSIDFAIRLTAIDEAAEFADTKEGTFAVRVAESMKVDAKLGGKIIDSLGREGDATWGRGAPWVDYSGPLTPPAGGADAPVGGIAILTHPGAFRAPCKWHVRSYGLFGANPFGQAEFPESDDAPQGVAKLAKGASIVLRHRVVLHDRHGDAATIDGWLATLAAEPLEHPFQLAARAAASAPTE
ncbi:MAG: PmoA family protein [Lacipirellulaceae bacterium]